MKIFSQGTPTVEKSIYSFQTGFLGIWANNELRLKNNVALRSEIGLDAGIFNGNYQSNSGYVFIPVVRLEPRWYYNLNSRNEKGKKIKNNCANFFTINFSYRPSLFVISNYEINKVNQISIIPKWGIRRIIGEHLLFETGIGLGYSKFFNSENTSNKTILPDLHFRLGYSF